ncbi:MAG: hypothetical protein AAFV49_05075 [Pseudomonadota bacterium]
MMSPASRPALRSAAAAAALAAALAVSPVMAPVMAEAQSAAPAPVPGAAAEAAPQSASNLRDERIRRIFREVRETLDEAAEERRAAQAGEATVIDRLTGSGPQARADRLLSAALEVVADAPIVELQREIAERRAEIEEAEAEITELREARIVAPDSVGLWDRLGGAQDRERIEAEIAEGRAQVQENRAAIDEAKRQFRAAMAEAGTEISPDQADLLLDSVTGDDIVRIAAAYDVVKGIGEELLQVMEESGEELGTARRYYAIHTTLIALLAHAQQLFIDKVDAEYLPKLGEIEDTVAETRAETRALLGDRPTEAQRTALEANLESQAITAAAADLYRKYLRRQRDEVAEAHRRTLKELRVADNTLRTVDASFRLHEIMRDATLEFESLQTLESPGFDAVFENRELRKKFEELSDKLRAPGS